MHSMKKSSSDTSMTFMDGDPNMKQGLPHSQSAPRVLESIMDDDTVPTVFRWEHGGRQVYITGTFNGWSRQIPMHRSGNDFTYIHNLKRGKHAFKFIVDDEWRFAPDQPTVADIEGRINNFIDVTDFKAYRGDRDFEKEKAAAEKAAAEKAAAEKAAAEADYDGDGVAEGTDEGTRPEALTEARGGQPDDLKLIKGVGPKLEQLCNSLGFYHFDQIAAWTADEVAWVDANLEGFKGRVSRDDWVAQAKILAAGGETEFSARQ